MPRQPQPQPQPQPRRRRRRRYTGNAFVSLQKAKDSLGDIVNIIGAVLECGCRWKCRGTDWYCRVHMMDNTLQNSGFKVNVFADSRDKLPQILSLGDIIQFQGVEIKNINKNSEAVFIKQHSTFAIYHGNDGSSLIPYRASEKFRPKDLDKTAVRDLRRWLHNSGFFEGANDFKLIKDISTDEAVNMVCKIIHIHEDAVNGWMAFAWDGTDATPAEIVQQLEDEMHHPLPLHLESLPLSRDTLCSFPSVGTVLRLTSEEIENDNLQKLKSGEWVKLVKLLCEKHAGLWRCVLTPFTRLRYTPNDDRLVLKRKSQYDKRLSQSPKSLSRTPIWSFPSQVIEVDDDDDDNDNNHAIFYTLMEVVTSSEVTSSFKCVVRVVSALPSQAQDFVFPAGIDRIRLTLEDSTARIHAFSYAEDGVKLFDDESSVEALKSKRNKLLGVTVSSDGEQDDTIRNPPWVRVCLKSETDDSGSRQYRIFGTIMVA